MSDGYQDLKVWDKAMELCERTYDVTAMMPVEESQMLNALIKTTRSS